MLDLLDRKRIRSEVIKEFLQRCDEEFRGVVCFSCGNASKALKDVGLDVIEITPDSPLVADGRWWTSSEIRGEWPEWLDATSGHLSMPLMLLIAERYKEAYKDLIQPYGIYTLPTGSGETLVCLKMAFPTARFWALYNINKGTKFDPEAPLNILVALLAEGIIKGPGY